MNKSLSTRLMYSFMAIIVIVVVGITAGTSYLIADYFFKIKDLISHLDRNFKKLLLQL